MRNHLLVAATLGSGLAVRDMRKLLDLQEEIDASVDKAFEKVKQDPAMLQKLKDIVASTADQRKKPTLRTASAAPAKPAAAAASDDSNSHTPDDGDHVKVGLSGQMSDQSSADTSPAEQSSSGDGGEASLAVKTKIIENLDNTKLINQDVNMQALKTILLFAEEATDGTLPAHLTTGKALEYIRNYAKDAVSFNSGQCPCNATTGYRSLDFSSKDYTLERFAMFDNAPIVKQSLYLMDSLYRAPATECMVPLKYPGRFTIYQPNAGNPALSAYFLNHKQQKCNHGGRMNYKPDPSLQACQKSGVRSTNVDSDIFGQQDKSPLIPGGKWLWKNNVSFDRGFLAPSYSQSWSQQVYHESFYDSNFAPFYSKAIMGPWKDFEMHLSDYAVGEEVDLFVVSGVAYDYNEWRKTNKPFDDYIYTDPTTNKETWIPKYFWYAVCQRGDSASSHKGYTMGYWVENNGAMEGAHQHITITDLEDRLQWNHVLAENKHILPNECYTTDGKGHGQLMIDTQYGGWKEQAAPMRKKAMTLPECKKLWANPAHFDTPQPAKDRQELFHMSQTMHLNSGKKQSDTAQKLQNATDRINTLLASKK